MSYSESFFFLVRILISFGYTFTCTESMVLFLIICQFRLVRGMTAVISSDAHQHELIQGQFMIIQDCEL